MNRRKKFNPVVVNNPTTISTLSHDGRGIATFDNKTTFIAGALPGESVTFKLTRRKNSHLEGEIIAFSDPSEMRTEPPCDYFNLCGGCSLQHMTSEAQQTLKQNTLLEQLKHFGNVTPKEVLKPLSKGTVGYRRKARLGAKYVFNKEKLLVGFREKSSSFLADISSCAVLHPKVGKRLTDLGTLIKSLTCFQRIPQIEVAIGDETCALIFRHLEPLTDEDLGKLTAFGQSNDFHIYLQPNSPEPISKLWPQDNHDRLTYTLPAHNLEFLFHPTDFTQVNLELNRDMVTSAINELDLHENETVLDLFCGIGNFTLPIARQVREVTGIEGSTEMTERAYENARHNKINNVTFEAANLFEPPQSAKWMQRQYDKILLDPPRAGAKEILEHIEQLSPKKIVYISCNPATLARDAGELVNKHGYQLQKVGIMNMFPHTAHIEAMAVFEKA